MPDTAQMHPSAGRPAPPEQLIDVADLLDRYSDAPDASDPAQRVAFGTSGHRGTSSRGSFNDAHIAAICQAVAEYRREASVTGPLVLAADTHALSGPAFRTALEVLVANDVAVVVPDDLGPVATPLVSHAILTSNGGREGLASEAPPSDGWADGIVITPSHNPPGDGGLKYNPKAGGPAATVVTKWIERRANMLLEAATGVRRIPFDRALSAPTVRRRDLHAPYVQALSTALDLGAVRAAGLAVGVDPLGGATLRTLELVAEVHALDLTVTNRRIDPTFAFMTVDHDGLIRMDCSSPHAMAGLIQIRDRFDVAFGSDPDGDRHGIVTRSSGLLAPNHYLAVAIDYLLAHRPRWPDRAAVGKTLVSSAMIDRVAERHRRRLHEVPVGFKWFVEGLLAGSIVFGGEESAGASFLRSDGAVWTTDKDGILLGLLAAEIMSVTGDDPGARYRALEGDLGSPRYRRVDAPATAQQRARLAALGPEDVVAETLAGDRIISIRTTATGNDAPIGGLKVVTEAGWVAARPSGTEPVSKLYAESWRGDEHLQRLLEEAQQLIATVTGAPS